MLEVSCEHFPESTNPLVYCLLAFNEDDEVKQDMGLRIVKRAVSCLSALSQPKAGLTCGMFSGISGATAYQQRQNNMPCV